MIRHYPLYIRSSSSRYNFHFLVYVLVQLFQTDRKYYPLMAVLIVYWPNLKQMCLQTKRNLGSLTICGGTLCYTSMRKYLWKIDKSIQTDFIIETEQTSWSAQNLSFNCRSSGCQTNFPTDTNTKRKDIIHSNRCCTCNHYYSEPFQPQYNRQNYFEYVVTFNPNVHFCTSHLKEELTESKSDSDSRISEFADSSLKNDACQTENIIENVSSEKRLNLQNATKNSNTNISLSPKVISCDEEYIYDEYNECYYEEPKTANENDPEATEETPLKVERDEILDKISKIGWTYTVKENSATDEANPENEDLSSYVSPPIGWKIPKENYNIYFDDKLNNKIGLDEEKDFETTSPKAPNESSENPQNLVTEAQYEPICTSRSRKSLVSLHGVKSRLGFLKIFSPKLIKLKKTASEEQVASKIKYKKMDSARSTIF